MEVIPELLELENNLKKEDKTLEILLKMTGYIVDIKDDYYCVRLTVKNKNEEMNEDEFDAEMEIRKFPHFPFNREPKIGNIFYLLIGENHHHKEWSHISWSERKWSKKMLEALEVEAQILLEKIAS